LSPTERTAARALPRTLDSIAQRLSRSPGGVAQQIAWGRDQLRAAGFAKVDYVEVCDVETLQPVDEVNAPARVFGAAWMGRTRLIDNVAIHP
jgi:pantoate--beta-alanine ligase